MINSADLAGIETKLSPYRHPPKFEMATLVDESRIARTTNRAEWKINILLEDISLENSVRGNAEGDAPKLHFKFEKRAIDGLYPVDRSGNQPWPHDRYGQGDRYPNLYCTVDGYISRYCSIGWTAAEFKGGV